MLRSSTKKNKKPFTFDQQLEFKLKTLKDQPTTLQTAAHKRKQIVTVLQQAVNQLQLQDESSIENLLPTLSRNPIPPHQQIQQINELNIEEHSSSLKFKHVHRDEISSDNKPPKSKKTNHNHIWNLVSNHQLGQFLMAKFENYEQEHEIMLCDFVRSAYDYYFGLRLQKIEQVSLQESLKYQLTTTDPQVLSLNALEILNKRTHLKHFLIQAYIEVQIKQRISELQRKNKKIMSEVTAKIDSLVLRQQDLDNNYNQLAAKQNTLNIKQKNIQLRQKQLLQRQKQIKKSVQEKCYKLTEVYVAQIADKVKQAEKKLNFLQKNIKTKIQLIQKKSLQLKQLITEANELKHKKNESEGEAKLRVRKLQRQIETLQKKYRAQIEQLQGEQKQLLRSISGLQQKVGKAQKKMKKQKERIEQLEELQSTMRNKAQRLQEQNRELNSRLEQIMTKIPQQNVLKIIKQKEKTSRSNKSKHKKHKHPIPSVVLLYQKILQICQLTPNTTNLTLTTKLLQLTKGLLPQILSLICNDEDNLQAAPHYLVLFVIKAILTSNFKSMSLKDIKDSQAQMIEEEEVQSRIWSNELSSLMQMPFSKVSKRSMFLFLLPLVEWIQPSAINFFISTVEQCCKDIEQPRISFEQTIQHGQLKLFVSKEIVGYLICSNLQKMVKQLTHPVQDNQKISNSLSISNSILNLFIQISKQQRQNIRDTLILKKLIAIFEVLTHSLIAPYQQQHKGSKKSSTFFKFYQTIEQLCQKLSILLQRITYDSQLLTSKCSNLGCLKRVHGQLLELNKVNGQRHSLILANLSSIVSMCQNLS